MKFRETENLVDGKWEGVTGSVVLANAFVSVNCI
jgi:hypothetical protein